MNLSSLIVIGICAMLVLAMGIIFFVMLYQRGVISHQMELKKINEEKDRELIQACIQSEERERMRIASELHDDVGATLSAARLFLYKAKDASYNEHQIIQSKKLLDESITKVRNMSHNLQPIYLQHIGLQAAIKSIIKTINNLETITAEHVILNDLPRLAAQTELGAYRISQELLNNIMKHASANSIKVETSKGQADINISFTHDGTGMTQESYEKHIYKEGAIGLKNIVSRLKSINAQIYFSIIEERLYKTELIIPLQPNSKPD